MTDNASITMYELCLLHARADRALRLVVTKQLEQFKLTMMEWLLLGVVCGGPDKGLSMSSIAGTLDVTLPQVTALVANLAKQKFVKQKTQLHDRRSRHVLATKRGRVVLQGTEEAIGKALQQWLTDIPPEDLEVYLKTVRHLSDQQTNS